MDEQFKEFLIKLFTQMSTGNFDVNVECADNKNFLARVIGYSEEYMTIKVKFYSNDLTKPGFKRVPRLGFGFGTSDDNDYILEETQVSVKEENVWYKNIKLIDLASR